MCVCVCYCRIVRAPVPWHSNYRETLEAQQVQLFIGNKVLLELNNLWHNK